MFLSSKEKAFGRMKRAIDEVAVGRVEESRSLMFRSSRVAERDLGRIPAMIWYTVVECPGMLV